MVRVAISAAFGGFVVSLVGVAIAMTTQYELLGSAIVLGGIYWGMQIAHVIANLFVNMHSQGMCEVHSAPRPSQRQAERHDEGIVDGADLR